MLKAFCMPFSVFQSNGWDASEMFRFNEETYGVKSTYDSSLSMYTYVDVLSVSDISLCLSRSLYLWETDLWMYEVEKPSVLQTGLSWFLKFN